MTLYRSYIGYLSFLGIGLFKSVLMYSNGTICLIKLLFKMGLFTVHRNTEKEKQLTEGGVGGGGGGRAESYDSERAWSSISHPILSVWLAYIDSLLHHSLLD
jgi:hypothetical protein